MSKFHSKKISLFALCSSVSLVASCGDDKDDSKASPTPTPVASALTLPDSFQTACVSCHSQGASDSNVKKGAALTEDAFVSFVRAGKGSMPGVPSTKISDIDLKTVWAYLKANP